MINYSIARPYTKAAFAYAREHDSMPAWSEQLQLLSAFVSHEQLVQILANPALSNEAQAGLLIDMVADHITEPVKRFVRVLADNERLNELPAISELFDDLKAEAERIINVLVTSAQALDTREIQELETALKAKLAQDVAIETQVDESLIGGVLVTAGDIVIDGSVKGRLQGLANQLA